MMSHDVLRMRHWTSQDAGGCVLVIVIGSYHDRNNQVKSRLAFLSETKLFVKKTNSTPPTTFSLFFFLRKEKLFLV